jgi:hypothetical protein
MTIDHRVGSQSEVELSNHSARVKQGMIIQCGSALFLAPLQRLTFSGLTGEISRTRSVGSDIFPGRLRESDVPDRKPVPSVRKGS